MKTTDFAGRMYWSEYVRISLCLHVKMRFAYCSSSGGVLRGTARNKFRVCLQQILIQAHMLAFGENGIIGLKVILLE
jgi:hypothetical protein